MDPFKILKVSKKDSLEKIRNAFKKVAKNVHPDKGGNEEMFNIVVEAYREIFRLKKLEEEKSFEEMKMDSRRYREEQNGKRSVHFAEEKYSFEDESFQNKFNQVFEDNRLGNANDDGYGNMMAKSSALREDINIERCVKSEKDLHNSFDTQKALNTDIVKYKEPEALCVQSKKLAYDELGVENIDDFSSDTVGKQLLYSDYMKAHTTNKLVDKTQIKEHKKFKNLDDIKKQRSKQSFALTDEDKKVIEEQERRIKMKEQRRKNVLAERDRLSQRHFEKVNRIMLG